MRTLRHVAVFLLVIAAIGAAWLSWALLVPYRNFPAEGVFVELPRGISTRGAALRLEDKGVVRNALAFELAGRWRGRPVQAGEYFFDRPATALEVFEKLATGRVYVRSVTIPEGLHMFQIADLLEREKFTSRAEFLAAAADVSAVRDLAPQARNLEGFLFPATYAFAKNTQAEQIVAAMVRRFREVWDSMPVRDASASPADTYEVVTLASLVERETRVADERPLVAGVYRNRLRKRIALQCDPTVIYAMELAGRNDGIIHQSDLRLKSPYNTYRHRGLPPGPIANPGQASLHAALYPSPGDYLYFVSNGQGGHFFSRTMKEHNARVAEYRRLTGQPPRNSAPRSPAGKTRGKKARGSK